MSDKKAPSIDSHLYNPVRTERNHLVTRAARLAPRTSVRYRLSRLNQPGGFFNLSGGEFNPHARTWALIFLVIGGAITGGVLSQGVLFHSVSRNPAYHGSSDPDVVTQLWDASDPNSNGGDFNLGVLASDQIGLWVGGRTLQLAPNSTYYANAISKNTFDPSSVSGKHLKFFDFWDMAPLVGVWPQNKEFDVYLTRNGTLPTEAGYFPTADKNVALVFRNYINGVGTWGHIIYLQTKEGETINTEDVGCGSGGSAQFCFTTAGADYDPSAHVVQDAFWLNFTGGSAPQTTTCAASGTFPQGGNDCTVIISTNSGTIGPTTGGGAIGTPNFFFQGQRYYVGVYLQAGITIGNRIALDKGLANAPLQIDPTGNLPPGAAHSFQFGVAQIISTAPAIAPTIDTGGFFGPVIRALVSIGVFIIQNILSFASYIWGFIQPVFTAIINLLIVGLAGFATLIVGVVKAILNAIGTGIGIPSLGDNLFTLFGDVSSFFTTFFGNALAQVGSFITFLNNGYTTVSSSFGTYWTDVVNWTSAIKDFLGGVWVIAGLLLTIPFTFAFSGWMLYGAKKFSDSVGEGMEWFSLTRMFLLIGFNIALWLLTFLIVHVITPSMHAIMATGEAKKTAEPDIVIGGTGVG